MGQVGVAATGAATQANVNPKNPYAGALPGGGLKALTQYLNWEKDNTPGFKPPLGFTIESDGKVQPANRKFTWQDWAFTAAAVGGPLALAFAAPAAAAGTAAGTGSGTAATGGLLASTTTVPTVGALAPGLASGTSAAGLGTAAAAGGSGVAAASGGLGPWGPIIGSGISAGANIYGANKAAGATKEAAALEAQSAANTLDFLKSEYADYKKNLSPYLQAGQGGLGLATGLLGLPTPWTAGKTGPINPNIPQGPWKPPGYAGDPNDPAMAGSSQLFYGGAGRPDATVGGTAPVPGVGPAGAVAGSGTTPGFVAMVAPDGSRKNVPAAFVTQAQAAGARLA